jgi:hypothetical protein
MYVCMYAHKHSVFAVLEVNTNISEIRTVVISGIEWIDLFSDAASC